MSSRPLTFYDDVSGLERYLNVPEGTLRHIPIYARVPAVAAILKVREMEGLSLFRPGLYYIVLADLVGNTAFNAKYGDAEGMFARSGFTPSLNLSVNLTSRTTWL
jgi:hypothetical protein